jgi:hypothetical protein
MLILIIKNKLLPLERQLYSILRRIFICICLIVILNTFNRHLSFKVLKYLKHIYKNNRKFRIES